MPLPSRSSDLSIKLSLFLLLIIIAHYHGRRDDMSVVSAAIPQLVQLRGKVRVG